MLRAHAARPMHCSLVICGLRKLTMNEVLGPRPHTTCMHVLVMCSSLPLASYLVLQCQLSEQLVDPDSAFDAIFSYMATRYSHFAPLTTILFDDITFPDAFDTLDFPDPTLSASPHHSPMASLQSPDCEGSPTPLFTPEQQVWIENLITTLKITCCQSLQQV